METSQSQENKYRVTLLYARCLEDSGEVDGGPGAGEGTGSQCLMGTESQFGKMRKFWRRMTAMVAGQGECT